MFKRIKTHNMMLQREDNMGHNSQGLGKGKIPNKDQQ